MTAASRVPEPIHLTRAEATAALNAIGQMTDGNARDFGEWHRSTSGTRAQWKALLRAECKIAAIVPGRRWKS